MLNCAYVFLSNLETMLQKQLILLIYFSSFVGTLFAQKPAEILKQPSSIVLSKQYRLNSSYREVNMNITPDGRYMFFMSSRGQMPWSKDNYLTYKGQAQYDGDIWYSEKIGKTWQTPKCLDASINTSMGEDEPNISPDGNTVYFQSWHNDYQGNSWQTDGGPYYKASRVGTKWGAKVGLGGGIHQFFKEFQYGTDGMTISPDGRTFIVAAGADYDGAMDLFISYFQNGKWTYPRKLPISTPGDERSPFIAADGETLYFASDGYKGFGGLDIYKVSLTEARAGNNAKVFNLGSPFNTASNDYGFMITSDGKEAYLIRDGNIFMADVSKSPKKMKPNETLIIKGVVRNAKTKRPLSKQVILKKACCNVAITDTWSNAATGEYMIILKKPIDAYEQKVSEDKNYEAFSKVIKRGQSNVIIADIDLIPRSTPETTTVADNELKKRQEEQRRRQEEIRKKQEEERKKKEEETRKRREEEQLRNQESACRM